MFPKFSCVRRLMGSWGLYIHQWISLLMNSVAEYAIRKWGLVIARSLGGNLERNILVPSSVFSHCLLAARSWEPLPPLYPSSLEPAANRSKPSDQTNVSFFRLPVPQLGASDEDSGTGLGLHRPAENSSHQWASSCRCPHGEEWLHYLITVDIIIHWLS